MPVTGYAQMWNLLALAFYGIITNYKLSCTRDITREQLTVSRWKFAAISAVSFLYTICTTPYPVVPATVAATVGKLSIPCTMLLSFLLLKRGYTPIQIL